MNKHALSLLCLGLLFTQSVLGQVAPAGKPEVSGRKAWLMATEVPKHLPNPVPVVTAGALREVYMHPRAIDQAVPVDETGVVRVVGAKTGKDGKVVYADLAICQIPEGLREALIVLVPKTKDGAKDAAGLIFNAKVIDLTQFKKGGCLYVNLVKTKIGVSIGEKKAVIDPGGMEFINALDGKDVDVLKVGFFYELPKGDKGEWELMNQAKMTLFRSRREICIFYYNEKIQNVDFRGVPFMTPDPLIK